MRYCVALLALWFTVAALAQSTAAPQGEGATVIDAESIEGVGDLEATARGSAEIRRDDATIFGDMLRFNAEFGRVQGEGGVRLQRGLDRFYGPRLDYNTLEDSGRVETPKYLLQRERTARGGADEVIILDRDRYRLKNATFTTCEPGRDDWVLQASEIDLDYAEEEGTALHPRLRFYDVPIFAFPIATFPLENRRRSGVLAPIYAQTSQRGFEVAVPYYWNIAPERDLTVTPVLMTKRGVQLKNLGRYLQQNYNGELRLEYLPYDRQFGASRTGVSWQHAQVFAPGFTGNLDYNKVSDDSYFTDLSSQVRQVSIGNLPQDAYVTYSGSLGRFPYSAQARVQSFQTLQDPQAPITPPYHRVPQLTFGATLNNLAGVFDSVLPAEAVRFTSPTLVEGNRFSINPVLEAPFLSPGWFVRPRVGLRAVSYDLDQTQPGQAIKPHAAIPWFSFDSGLVFERGARFFGEQLTQTLEPRVFYVRVPYRNQNAIPIFDTALADYNFTQLFSENRFSGGDRFGDANQVTLALSSRFLTQNGQEALRATIGQRYYFEPEQVGLTPTSPLRTNSEADLLASVGGRLFRHWTFDTTVQYSRFQQQTELFNASIKYAPEIAKVLNASYRLNEANSVRQIDLATQWPISAGWYGVARYNYSFLDKRLLEGLAGVEYNAGCWVLRTVVTQVQAASNVTSTGFFLQIEFNGVGQAGTDDVVGLLTRNIPGYQVTNPRNEAVVPPSRTRPLPFQQVY
jgi:LPS-assembly protein